MDDRGSNAMLVIRRTIVAALAICFLGIALTPALEAQDEDAGAFLESLNRTAFEKLADPALSRAEKERNFRGMFREGFDLPAISRFVLGKYWRKADTAQRDAFLDAFEELHMRRFLPMFAEISDKAISIKKIQPDAKNDSLQLVSSVISRSEGEDIAVVWRIRHKDDKYKVLDIVAEGVSMAISLRHEYGTVVKANGLDGLIDMMRGKNAELAAE
jgi:phospholipid transport system substrate-binding protein